MVGQHPVPGVGGRGEAELFLPGDQIADIGIIGSAGVIPEYEVHVAGHIVNVVDTQGIIAVQGSVHVGVHVGLVTLCLQVIVHSVEMLVVILSGKILLEQVGIVAHFVAAYMDGLAFGEDFRQLVQHIEDHLLGFRFSHIHGGAGSAVGIIVLLEHIGVEGFQLGVLIPVADGVEDGDDCNIIVFCVFN